VAERDVEDVETKRLLVGDRKLNRHDHVAGRAVALVVQHAKADEACVRRHAGVLAARQRAAACNKTGDVGPVAIPVDRGGCDAALAVAEVVERRDAARQIGNRRDAGIDDRDPHTAAGRVGVG
jgi:hypothetical protein